MSIFFIMRVHFVFNRSKMRIKPVLLYSMLFFPVASFIIASVGGIGGPLHVFGEHDFTIPSRLGFASTIINIFTDLWVTGLYAERLIRVVMMQSEVSTVTNPTRKSATFTKDGQTTTNVAGNSNGNTTVPTDSTSPQAPDNVPEINTNYSNADQKNGERPSMAFEMETVTTVTLSEKHIQIITRSSLLNLIAVISSLIVQVIVGYRFLTDRTDPFLTKAIISLDSAVNAWTMYLVFSFSKIYYNFLCHFPHKMCRMWCRKMAKEIVLRAEDAKGQDTTRTIWVRGDLFSSSPKDHYAFLLIDYFVL